MLAKSDVNLILALEKWRQSIDVNQQNLQIIRMEVNDKNFYFYCIHQSQQQYAQVRQYRQAILSNMGLDNKNPPIIQVIGDSSDFNPAALGYLRQFLFTFLDKRPLHHVLYGITSQRYGTNGLINEWIALSPANLARTLGLGVSLHTLLALTDWHNVAGEVSHLTMLYPDGKFGDDLDVSDNFVPQFDNAPGASEGICLDGGVQSFLQLVNMLKLDILLWCLEKLRNPNNPAYQVGEHLVAFFSAAEFFNTIKRERQLVLAQGRELTPEDVQAIKDRYLYDPAVHGEFDFEKHKHLHFLSNPLMPGYDLKLSALQKGFDELLRHELWKKSELIHTISGPENIATQASLKALVARKKRASLSEDEARDLITPCEIKCLTYTGQVESGA